MLTTTLLAEILLYLVDQRANRKEGGVDFSDRILYLYLLPNL